MLSLRGQRMEVLSRNIANADTPNFKAQDLDFRDVLKNAGSTTSIKATHQNHISNSTYKGSAEMVYTVPFNSSVDGNTVELCVEQAKYGKALRSIRLRSDFLRAR